MHVVEIVEKDDEESYDPDDVLERQFIMLPKKIKLRYQKELETFTRERKRVSGRQ
jgi:hypothetical protein